MTVQDIRNIEPLAEVYEISPDARYIIRLPKDINIKAAQRCCELVNEMGCKALVFRTDTKLDIMEYDNRKINEKTGEW
jgi:hypothetical protein